MDDPRIRLAVHFLALLFTGLIAGAVLAVWQGYDPRGLNAAAFVAMHQGAVRGHSVLMPALALGSLVFIAVSAWYVRNDRVTLGLFGAALLCLVAAGVITAVYNQPVNAEVMGWTAARVPRNWAALRETWWYWHVVRTVLVLAGFALVTAGVLWSRESERA